MSGELLQFPGDVVGMVLNLEQDQVGAVLLGDDKLIKEGDIVKRTNRITQVPVGEALTGRVVNALGQPVDGKGPINAKEFRPIERYARGVTLDRPRSEEHTSELQSLAYLVCRLLLEKKKYMRSADGHSYFSFSILPARSDT